MTSIKIGPNALRALFTDNPEALVEVTQRAVEAVSQRIVTKTINEKLEARISQIIASEVDLKGWPMRLGDKVRGLIREEIKLMVQAAAFDTPSVREAFKEELDLAVGQAQVRYWHKIQDEVSKQIKTQLDARVAALTSLAGTSP